MSDALRELREIVAFAYAQGYHEPGYDPVAELEAALVAPSSKGAADIAIERARQISQEGWTAEHDDRYDSRELSIAAECYMWGTTRIGGRNWPWRFEAFKPDGIRRNLVKAGALIAAEIDRIDRVFTRIDAKVKP